MLSGTKSTTPKQTAVGEQLSQQKLSPTRAGAGLCPKTRPPEENSWPEMAQRGCGKPPRHPANGNVETSQLTTSRRSPLKKGRLRSKGKSFEREVQRYCFCLAHCGTFMPLSSVRGESRIALCAFWLRRLFHRTSSVRFRILFRRQAVGL